MLTLHFTFPTFSSICCILFILLSRSHYYSQATGHRESKTVLKMYLFTCNHHQNNLRLMLCYSKSCFISITSSENIRKGHMLWCWPLFKRKTNTDTNLDKDSSKHVKYSLAFSTKRKIVNLLQLHRDTLILKLNRIHQLHQ